MCARLLKGGKNAKHGKYSEPMRVRLLTAFFAVMLLLGGVGRGALWQYSAPIGDRGARAFLFIPPQCERVRGALIALDNLAEKPLLEDAVIREAAGAEDLAIISLGSHPMGDADVR